MDDPQGYVFVSYARADEDAVDKLVHVLEGRGIRVASRVGWKSGTDVGSRPS
jgi:hypothetical protein